MADRDKVNRLKETLRGIVETHGCECVGIDISVSAHASVLRIFIDTPEGVGHSECAAVSKTVTEYIDGCEEGGAAWFPGRYLVEVSSPGLERPLLSEENYRRFAGRRASLVLNDGKKLEGVIASCIDGLVSLETDGGA
ncbi:MAG: hypothetical protein LBQ56_04405, partial [Synergistaceae bacterium]|nr:hypothetical protein [Synergistaceae bacterium]